MPTVVLSRPVVEQLIGKKLSMEQFRDRISMLGTNLEKIEGDAIHVEVFPNRPDLLSEQGLARALASFIGARPGLRKYAVKEGKGEVIIDKGLKGIRPYTACAIVRNLRLDAEGIREIIQMQEKLHTTFCRNRRKSAIGIYPLEHITLPITFTAMKPAEIAFQPLDAEREMTAAEILEQHPKGREFAHLLHGLPAYPMFLDASGNVLSMPPIINSAFTGRVTEQTRDVFVEFSGFDLAHLTVGLHIFLAALADMGGQLESMELCYSDRKIRMPDFAPRKMKLDLPALNKRLGLSLREAETAKLLARMGYGYEKGHALVPAYRADILHQVDLAEDIAIAYGYEHFAEVIPTVATVGEQHLLEVQKQRIADILIGLGMLEVNTYHLLDRDAQTALLRQSNFLEILDPVSLEYNTLRETILASLLQVLRENRGREYPQRIFDMGTVFARDPKSETGVAERAELAAVIAHPEADYTEALQHLDYLMRMLAVPYSVKAADAPPFIPGRAAQILIRGKVAGMIGEVHPQVLSTLGLELPVVGFSLALALLR